MDVDNRILGQGPGASCRSRAFQRRLGKAPSLVPRPARRLHVPERLIPTSILVSPLSGNGNGPLALPMEISSIHRMLTLMTGSPIGPTHLNLSLRLAMKNLIVLTMECNMEYRPIFALTFTETTNLIYSALYFQPAMTVLTAPFREVGEAGEAENKYFIEESVEILKRQQQLLEESKYRREKELAKMQFEPIPWESYSFCP